jgi:hypothetical protein
MRRDRERADYVEANGDVCELCGVERGQRGMCMAVRRQALNQDHSHAAGHGNMSGYHRGWICGRANQALHGWMTPAWLRLAADYLEKEL